MSKTEAPKAIQATVILCGGKATTINGSDMDIGVSDDGRLTIYDYPAERSHSGPVFVAVQGQWLVASLTFDAHS